MNLFLCRLLLLLFVALTFSSGISFAQNYEPFIKSDGVWTEGTFGSYPDFSGLYSYKKYSFVGDTLINGQTYRKMYLTRDMLTFDIDHAEYIGAMREVGPQVFMVGKFQSSEMLYLDFSLEVGDTTTVYGGPVTVEVIERDSVLLENGEYRDRIKVEYPCNFFNETEYWIEGVGSTSGILRPFFHCYTADVGYKELICHEEQETVVYKKGSALSCEQLSSVSIFLGDNNIVGIGDEPYTPDTICPGQMVSIDYNIWGGTHPMTVSVSPEAGFISANFGTLQVNPDTTTTYTITVTDLAKDTAQLSLEIFVKGEFIEPVEIDIINPTGSCLPDSLILSANNTYDFYEWQNGQDSIIGTEQTLTVYTADNYSLTVSNIYECSETNQLWFYPDLTPNPLPVRIRSNIEDDICVGDTLLYWVEEPYLHYFWSTQETTDTISIVAGEEGSFFLSINVVDFNGCVNSSNSLSYLVSPLPDVPIITPNGTVLTASEAITYQWYLNDMPIEGATERTYTAIVEGDYTVEVTGYTYCSSISAALTVEASQLARQVAIKVYLEGAYDPSSGEMDHKLLDLDLLPMSQPYDVAPWNYGGTESVMSSADFPSNTVDWVLVEARTGTPNQSGSMGTTVVETKAGLLLGDGSIVDAQSLNPLAFALLENGTAYYFVVRHRNHLDVIGATSVVGATLMTYDFTTAVEQAFGVDQMKVMDVGKVALLAGDYNSSGDIQNTDNNAWKENPAVNQAYLLIDGNMDGLSQVSDYDIWYFNRAKLGVIEIRY